MKAKEDNTKNQKEIAKLMGVTTRQVRMWDEQGCPRNKDGSYSIKDVAFWKKMREEKIELEKPKVSTDIKEEQEKVKLEKMKLEVDIMKGKYTLTEEVEQGFLRRLNSLTKYFAHFEAKIPAMVVGKTLIEIKDILSAQFRQMRILYSTDPNELEEVEDDTTSTEEK